MVPPFGMGMSPEKGAKEKAGTIKLSPRQGFELMKRQAQERRARDTGGHHAGYSYRNPDWHERYIPRPNANNAKTFFATPSVAKPVYDDDSAAAEEAAEASEAPGRNSQKVFALVYGLFNVNVCGFFENAGHCR